MKSGLLLIASLTTSSLIFASDFERPYDCIKNLDSRVEEQSLTLKSCNLSDENMKIVSAFLKNHPQIESLNLDDNMTITASGYSYISKNINIKSLSLNSNLIEDDSLAEIVKMKNIRVLDLSNNDVGDFSLLVLLPDLQWLDLSNNGLDDEMIADLVKSVSSNKMLSYLLLNSNFIGEKGGLALINLTQLEGLSLRNNILRDKGANNISKSGIPILDLYDNIIGDEGTAALASNWKPRNSFYGYIGLGLSKNNISDKGAIALANNSIPKNFSLDVMYNIITKDGIQALKSAKNITQLASDGDEEIFKLAIKKLIKKDILSNNTKK